MLYESQRGNITMALTGETAQRVLDHLQKLSEPFGTRFDIQNGVGVIRASD